MITNQQVFTVATSRRGHSAALRRMLNRAGILSYYTFSVKGFAENRALAVPNCRLMQEMQEEKIYGQLTAEVTDMLRKIAQSPENIVNDLDWLLDSCRLPFVATDRNVMNLPGIGKSMTFTTVAVLPDGRRVLYFTFDNGRFIVLSLPGWKAYISQKVSRSPIICVNWSVWENGRKITVPYGIIIREKPRLPPIYSVIRNRKTALRKSSLTFNKIHK